MSVYQDFRTCRLASMALLFTALEEELLAQNQFCARFHIPTNGLLAVGRTYRCWLASCSTLERILLGTFANLPST
ncbi:hypothetical protein F4777DRAFT_570932 [Nemania sp. FL0916]|nr:hypothetical protein F4777DRAFT_570932 [Nemania sp. FL0916]